MKRYLLAASLMCVPVSLLAWQGGMAAIGVTESGLLSQIESATRQKGEGLTLVRLSPIELAAAKALGEPQRAALMKELAAATKLIMMSAAFQSGYDAYIATAYKAVNHGLKVKSAEQLAQQTTTAAGEKEFALKMQRDVAAIYVQMAMSVSVDNLKMMLDSELEDWTKNANNVKHSERAKYAKLVAKAKAIKELSASEPDKFRRGYAVLKSTEADGLDTEEALFGAVAKSESEAEQLLWDQHNLRGALKRGLTQIVAEAPTVDFAAETVEQSKVKVFVNPAYEKKSLAWKAMYRAGKAPTAAGLEIAKAWLKEL